MSRPCFIRSTEYDDSRKELVVRMVGGTSFRYDGVPAAVGASITRLAGDELIHAFDTGIEGKFKSARVA